MTLAVSKLRELSPEEWELVSGGDITVTGRRYDDWDWSWYHYWNFGGEEDYGGGGGGGGETEPAPPPDSESHDVVNNIGRPLTPQETQALEAFKAAIAKIDTAIQAIPDNARLTLPDGTTVTGAELKAIWAVTDFEIVDNTYPFPNGSNRGEADYNNGDPVVRSNIGNLVNYGNLGEAGLIYLALHEVAHFTGTQTGGYSAAHADGVYTEAERHAHEQEANDIARAIAYAAGLAQLATPGDGYSPSNPTFVLPPPVEPDDPGYSDYYDQWIRSGYPIP